ncbi:hypothetical protein S122051_2632 [Staphylococcus aureus subsp. aureus 122051]|nr:hypothetical protein S122051_2632 [Staphylococcus aureus subsp. aureus 122051]
MQLPAKQSYLQLAKKHFLAGLTIFKSSNSFLLILTYLFGMNQLINGKNKLIQVLIISTIKYSSLYLIILYLGFLLMILDSHSNIYQLHFLGLI